MIKNPIIISGIQDYERGLDVLDKLENTRERTIEQSRFKMAVIFEPTIIYEMQVNQGKGRMLLNRPKKADAIMQNNKQAVKELLNLISFGINVNLFLNNNIKKQIKIVQKLDSAIVKEYGDKFH